MRTLTPILNYVWMSERPTAPKPIPSSAFCMLQNNAISYPHTSINLWVETPISHKPYWIPDNVRVRDLSELKECHPLLTSDDSDHLWNKVDLARLVMLQKVLDEQPQHIAVYSDFDVKDTQHEHPDFRLRIKTYGMILAQDPRNGFENSYSAFTQQSRPILDGIVNRIITSLSPESWDNDAAEDSFIYGQIIDFLDEKIGEPAGNSTIPPEWRNKIGLKGIVASSGACLSRKYQAAVPVARPRRPPPIPKPR